MTEAEEDRPCLLSIAGFDPSSGAGILADIKTFESNKVYGLGICSALTFQNEREFEGLNWVTEVEIIRQAKVLYRSFKPEWIKFGIIESLSVLGNVTAWLKAQNPDVKIIWDPIFRASAGFSFHKSLSKEALGKICSHLFLVTPNTDEMQMIYPDMLPQEGAGELSKYCNVLLKGGHTAGDFANDMLYDIAGNVTVFEGERLELDKHGTGCVLSSAILSNLAKGYELKKACSKGKDYVTDFIKSHNSLVGYHYV
jgi:hydroxymethylpyrimidine/phosphomethylpyrimidine kinase